MTVKTKCHVQAFVEVFELVLIASVVALLADTGWVFHDILVNGLSIQYILIASGLLGATAITVIAFLKHHANNYKNMVKVLLVDKMNIQRRKNKHSRGIKNG